MITEINSNSVNPLITVYIPTRNRSRLLLRAVDSVLAQDYPNVELLIVDDASNDDTQALLNAHSERDHFIVFSLRRPHGASYARNVAINHANGIYITGMDDDDALTPTRLSELVRCYQAGTWSCVASTYQEIYESKVIVRRLETGVIDYESIRHYNKIGNQVLTSTERLRAIGGFDSALPAFQDYDTWIRLIDQFGPAYKLSNPSYLGYITHSENRISDDRTKVRLGFARFLKKHRHRLEPTHRKSMMLLSHKVKGTPITFSEFIHNVNLGNYKLAVPLFINSHGWLKPVKAILRLRFHKLKPDNIR